MKYEVTSIGFILIVLGLLLVFIGMMSGARKAEAKGGGIVMVGPIPIVFGTDVESVKTLIVLMIILILAAALALRWWR